MNEVLRVVDSDDLDERAFRVPRPVARWRRHAVGAGVVVLALLTGVALTGRSVREEAGETSPFVAASPAPAAVPTTGTPATSATPSSHADTDPRIVAAEAALDAWGRFGVTGDLALLEGLFDPAGPQYALFVGEAPSLAAAPPGPPPYTFELSDPVVGETGGEPLVRGAVRVSRPGEAEQRFDWELILREDTEGGWRVWTVRDLRPGTEPDDAPGG